jgi:predicted HTH transcriptional regulator
MVRTLTADEVRGLGEAQTVEFKKSLQLQDEALRALCGMVNADAANGAVVFGVAPDGIIAGVEPGNLDTAQRSLNQRIASKFEPRLIVQMEPVECDGKRLLILQARRPKTVPYHEYDGRALIREGSETRGLSLEEKRRLTKQRDRDQHGGPWRCERCGSIVGVLHAPVITATPGGIVIGRSFNCQCGGEFWPLA